jgi:cell division transport system permease protein
MLPFLVAAMAFLAALALAGWIGAASLAQHWQQGSGSALTVQVPQPKQPAAQGGGTRLGRVLELLVGTPGVASAHALTDDELADLLHPWLGSDVQQLALPLPAVIAVHLTSADAELDGLDRRLNEVAPGTLMESHGVWIRRLAVLARSLQACAGLAARREAIEIVHGLGATDGYIAARFAGRATMLGAVGGLAGTLLALPVLLMLGRLAAPFAGGAVTEVSATGVVGALPPALWFAIPGLPAAAAAIGYLTAQGTVRRWLRHLP